MKTYIAPDNTRPSEEGSQAACLVLVHLAKCRTGRSPSEIAEATELDPMEVGPAIAGLFKRGRIRWERAGNVVLWFAGEKA